jgi:DNA (cytosine-5)-methyltransferase 1
MSLALHPQHNALHHLSFARRHHSQGDIARALGITQRTVRRWELKETTPSPYLAQALQRILWEQLPRESEERGGFKFIDLFAGIGGMRMAFETIGGNCVFTSEWDSYAQKTYAANFHDLHPIAGDITQIDAATIPDHDVLLAGFPCQPFSIAGVSKKASLGRAHGFSDATQGTLFFDVARIIATKRPKAFLLENVKNLQSHDKGRTFEVIKQTLTQELGYQLHTLVIDGARFVPQHRERIMMVGFREPQDFKWDRLPMPEKGNQKLARILDKENSEFGSKYILSDKLWNYLQNYKKKHEAKGNGFGFGLVTADQISRTLSARYYKDGSEILISRGEGLNPRRLTPRECARLMGFPDSFQIPVSDTRAYKQFGNSVVMPLIAHIAKLMQPFIASTAMTSPVTARPAC